MQIGNFLIGINDEGKKPTKAEAETLWREEQEQEEEAKCCKQSLSLGISML